MPKRKMYILDIIILILRFGEYPLNNYLNSFIDKSVFVLHSTSKHIFLTEEFKCGLSKSQQ